MSQEEMNQEEVQETVPDSTQEPAEQEVQEASAPSTEETEETEAQETEPVEGAKKSKLQDRFDKLTREKYDAESQAKYWRELAMRNTQTQQTPKAQTTEQPEASTPEPREEDYETNTGYIKAVIAHDREKNDVITRQRVTQQKADERTNVLVSRQNETIGRGFEAYGEDFADAASNCITPNVESGAYEMLVSSPQSHHIVQYLYKNRDDAIRLANMSDITAAKEIGALEARFSTTPNTRKISKAPQPTTPISGVGNVATTKKVEDMSQKEYEAARESGKLR